MNVNINDDNSIIEIREPDSWMEWFDIENGLLGIERDTFLLFKYEEVCSEQKETQKTSKNYTRKKKKLLDI
jgi:hypothetical protein